MFINNSVLNGHVFPLQRSEQLQIHILLSVEEAKTEKSAHLGKHNLYDCPNHHITYCPHIQGRASETITIRNLLPQLRATSQFTTGSVDKIPSPHVNQQDWLSLQ